MKRHLKKILPLIFIITVSVVFLSISCEQIEDAMENDVAEEPAVEEPVEPAPENDEPAVEEPAVDEARAFSAILEAVDPGVPDEDPAIDDDEEPITDEEPVTEEPAIDDEEPAIDDEDPVTEEPAIEDEEPITDEDPVTEEPAITEEASGIAAFILSEDMETISYSIYVDNLQNPEVVQFHSGADLEDGDVIAEIQSDEFVAEENTVSGLLVEGTLSVDELMGHLEDRPAEDIITDIEGENMYVTIVTAEHPEGELSGQLVKAYVAELTEDTVEPAVDEEPVTEEPAIDDEEPITDEEPVTEEPAIDDEEPITEEPAITEEASGIAVFVLDEGTNSISYYVYVDNLQQPESIEIRLGQVEENGEAVAELQITQVEEDTVSGLLAEGILDDNDLTGQLEGMSTDDLMQEMDEDNVFVVVLTADDMQLQGQVEGSLEEEPAPVEEPEEDEVIDDIEEDEMTE